MEATSIQQPPAVISTETLSQPSITVRREDVLQSLLDGSYGDGIDRGNYEYAMTSGLIDLFAYDPISGKDGLLHTLAGEVLVGENGAQITEGFHHEPSADYGVSPPGMTRVDREHLQFLNAKDRSEFKSQPFNPYKAKSFIQGVRKLATRIDPETGEKDAFEAKTQMFPKEYDALAVMQTVKIAYDNRDESADSITANGKIVNTGFAPMLDGETLMKVQLILDPVTKKILTAYPIVKVSGFMRLADASIQACLGLQ